MQKFLIHCISFDKAASTRYITKIIGTTLHREQHKKTVFLAKFALSQLLLLEFTSRKLKSTISLNLILRFFSNSVKKGLATHLILSPLVTSQKDSYISL